MRADVDARLLEDELAEPLVHRHRGRGDTTAHVGDAAQLERPEQAAVLAAGAVDRADGDVDLEVAVALEARATE